MTEHAKFLAALTKLSLRYRMRIHGCGCCGSPYLIDLKEGETGSYTHRDGEQIEFEIEPAP